MPVKVDEKFKYVAHEPTEATRAMVKSMTAHGIKQPDISKYLDISVETLHKYYRPEIDAGKTEVVHSIAKCVTEQALLGCRQSQKFYLSTQAGWSEKTVEALAYENETLKEEAKRLREELAEKHKQDY